MNGVMPKESKKAVLESCVRMSTLKKCSGKESLQRMNYLLQLSNQLATENQAAHVASLQYTHLTISISKKAVQRLEPDIKRTLCKGCRSMLIPGITCKVRIKKKNVIKYCLKCTQVKKIYTQNKEHTPWHQKNESRIELIDYTPRETTISSMVKQNIK